MAYTASALVDSVMGNKLVKIVRYTADAAEANITTGLSSVEHVSVQLETGQTMPVVKANANSSGTASNGVIGVSGSSSGNVFRAFIVGY